ncbi:MAG: peptidase T [Candidatus Binatia bacterium]|nr:MAG: peptidase T [Candidatus Binatia bacterium]
MPRRPVLLVHGGAGRKPRTAVDEIRAALVRAVRAGWDVLARGGPALDAVTESVRILEDDPHFNAGYGSVLTSEGTVETDASVMDGESLRAGACGATSGVKNPVLLARALAEDGRHVLIVGEAARRFAERAGLSVCAPGDLVAPEPKTTGSGTVGAVALDIRGHVAAATSTGGKSGKLPGRVGDSAVPGAGTYADDAAGAASATGDGETILRLGLTRLLVHDLGEGLHPQEASRRVVRLLGERLGGEGGVVAVDVLGRIGYACNTEHMSVAWMVPNAKEPEVRP